MSDSNYVLDELDDLLKSQYQESKTYPKQLLTDYDALKRENAALKLENKALQQNSSCYPAEQSKKLKQQNKELEIKTVALQQSNDHLKAESAVLSAMIDQLNEQLSEKSKPLGDMANFSGLKTPKNVYQIS